MIVESGTPSFQLLGFLIFAASSASEAARVVGSQLLLGRERFNQAEVLVYVSTPSAVLLLLGSAVLELPKMRERGVVPPVLLLAFSSTVSCLVNLASYAAIGSTSSLTFKVSGCVKNLAVVWFSTLAYAEHVAIAQVCGRRACVFGGVFGVWGVQRRHSRRQPLGVAAALSSCIGVPTSHATPLMLCYSVCNVYTDWRLHCQHGRLCDVQPREGQGGGSGGGQAAAEADADRHPRRRQRGQLMTSFFQGSTSEASVPLKLAAGCRACEACRPTHGLASWLPTSGSNPAATRQQLGSSHRWHGFFYCLGA